MVSSKKLLSQVFLKDRKLVSKLVKDSSIGKEDAVLEVGPGKGIITDELLKKAGRVIAVEKDPELFRSLTQKYGDREDIKLHKADIMRFDLPQFAYKVFSNIPFAIEGKLIRKLIDESKNSPLDTYLIIRRVLAKRMAGAPKEGEFSVIHKPWFEIEIFYNFDRDDFEPKPKVESSMIRFKRRDKPLIDLSNKREYFSFIKQGFGGGRRINKNLSKFLTSGKLNLAAQQIGFRFKSKPSDLKFEEWVRLFKFYKKEK